MFSTSFYFIGKYSPIFESWLMIILFGFLLMIAPGSLGAASLPIFQPATYYQQVQLKVALPIHLRMKAASIALPKRKQSIGRFSITEQFKKQNYKTLEPGVLGTVAFKIGSTSFDRQWRRTQMDQQFSARATNWLQKFETRSSVSFEQGLNRLNRLINQSITYQVDQKTYNRADYWAAPSLVLKNGKGDCEDIAILKYHSLRQLGVPETALQLVIVKDTALNRYHAITALHVNGQIYVLDSRSERVLQLGELRHYNPLISFSGENRWIHGIKRPMHTVIGKKRVWGKIKPG